MEVLVEGRVGEGGAVCGAQVGEAAHRRLGQRSDEALVGEQLGGLTLVCRGAGAARLRQRCIEWARAHGRIEPVTRAADPPKALDDVGLPPGHVAGDLLEHRQRALAAAVMDRLCDLQALSARVVADQPGPEQVADVRDDPVVARLDRLVGPQPIDAAPSDRHLSPDAGEQLLKRSRHARHVAVQRAVHPREQLPQPVAVVAVIAIVHLSHRPPP